MSDAIKHECGIVLIRLLKPLEYYHNKYGTDYYALNKLYLMMEKQHNRGQEGAGIACVRLHSVPGEEYIFRQRDTGTNAISNVFANVYNDIEHSVKDGVPSDARPFLGEIYIGHLRYSTTGRSGISYTHPFLRRNNWQSRNLCLAGNFNITNVDEIMDKLTSHGQHPRHNADTFLILEQMGSLLDEQVEQLYRHFKYKGLNDNELNRNIEENVDMTEIIKKASAMWDGGFAIIGATGHGDSFIFRDKWGIRPAHYYIDDEIVVAASERAVIQTVMDVKENDVKELMPGESLVIKRNGKIILSQIHSVKRPTPCSFERIYFSRGSDSDIYRERKELGKLLTEEILEAIDYDTYNTVFSFIPNTAEVAYYGMMEGLNEYLDKTKAEQIESLGTPTQEQIHDILRQKIRTEKLAIKDIKLRTFIAEGNSRNDLAAHVYDITYGTITPGVDTIVVIDDSIVRGTTLRQSIIKILGRLSPEKIIIVSSSPQIRYPDCYGIDMSKMGEFIAFNAAIQLLIENGKQQIIDEVYHKCIEQRDLPKEQIVNHVKDIYAPFSDKQISDKIASMITPSASKYKVEVIFQTIDNLHKACPKHNGDWYFSGNYPTPGGNRLVNNAFINFYENGIKK